MNDILTFHKRLEKATGIRDLGLIESAVNAPFQTFGGEFLYPKVEERAAGNKKIFLITNRHSLLTKPA